MNKKQYINNVTVVVSVLAVWGFGLLTGSTIENRKPVLDNIHKVYNHVVVYEDGSYVGQTSEGRNVHGCVKGGLCDGNVKQR